MTEHFEVVVIGAGAAGLTAGMVAARHGLRVVVVDQVGVGGQVLNVVSIEDYPGIADGIAGYEFGPLLHGQAEAAGAEFRLDTIEVIESVDEQWQLHGAQDSLEAPALIVATGSTTRSLGKPGEVELLGRGVSHCASCDGPLYAGRDVCVVGGGDSAVQEAITVADYAAHVTVVFDGDALTAQVALCDKLTERSKIELMPAVCVEEILGDASVSAIRLRSLVDESMTTLNVAGVFVDVGLEPSSLLVEGLVELDSGGHIETDIMMRTSRRGIFAAGDVRSRSVSQLASAVGDGTTAAIAAYRYLQSRP